ncbi:MAG TPA: DUF547 domain-containing protein [Thermoanaerobaculia bacterium]|jgi:hypothetical protein
MRKGCIDAGIALAILIPIAACGQSASESRSTEPIAVRAGIGHEPWGRLLKKFVDERGLVDYAAWKASAGDRKALREYLDQFAPAPQRAAEGPERIASLINAYNAFTVDWILSNYPTASIQSLKDSFTGARHSIGGRKVSLDDIEHRTLRPLAGYRVHAVLSCASRSCPPLAREAYDARRLESQLDARMGVWLAREDLNRFLPAEKKAQISEVFRWNLEDFQKAGGLRSVLRRHAPERFRSFLSGEDYTIEYLTYDWGLNDRGEEGRHYGRLRLLWDEIRDRLR